MSTTSTDPGNKSPGQIEREVEATRASVSGTLDELRGKFEPRQIVDQVVEQVADYARSSGGADFARNLGAAMRDNPLPVMLIGAGIGWLFLSGSGGGAAYDRPMRRDTRSGDSGSGVSGTLRSGREHLSHAVGTAKDSVTQARDSANHAVSSATATVGDMASRVADAGSAAVDRLSGAASEGMRMAGDVRERVSDATATLGDNFDDARERVSSAAHDAVERLGSLAEEQPLLLGLLGVALGAAVGAALPRTGTEDRLLGDTRDTVVGRLAEASGEALEEVRTVAGEQIEQVKGALAETYSDTREKLANDGVAGVGSALGNAASQAAQAVGGAVSNVAAHAASRIEEAGTPKQQRGAD